MWPPPSPAPDHGQGSEASNQGGDQGNPPEDFRGYLPSEVARLVLGYLHQTNCPKTAQLFFKHCPFLYEARYLQKNFRAIPQQVENKNLQQMLQHYYGLTKEHAATITQRQPGSSTDPPQFRVPPPRTSFQPDAASANNNNASATNGQPSISAVNSTALASVHSGSSTERVNPILQSHQSHAFTCSTNAPAQFSGPPTLPNTTQAVRTSVPHIPVSHASVHSGSSTERVNPSLQSHQSHAYTCPTNTQTQFGGPPTLSNTTQAVRTSVPHIPVSHASVAMIHPNNSNFQYTQASKNQTRDHPPMATKYHANEHHSVNSSLQYIPAPTQTTTRQPSPTTNQTAHSSNQAPNLPTQPPSPQQHQNNRQPQFQTPVKRKIPFPSGRSPRASHRKGISFDLTSQQQQPQGGGHQETSSRKDPRTSNPKSNMEVESAEDDCLNPSSSISLQSSSQHSSSATENPPKRVHLKLVWKNKNTF